MIFNFEHEIDGMFFDCDAEARVAGHDQFVMELLEVRHVIGDGYNVVRLDHLRDDLRAELLSKVQAEHRQQAEDWSERTSDPWR